MGSSDDCIEKRGRQAQHPTRAEREWLAVLRYPHLPVTKRESRRGQQVLTSSLLYAGIQIPPIQISRYTDKDDQKFLEHSRL